LIAGIREWAEAGQKGSGNMKAGLGSVSSGKKERNCFHGGKEKKGSVWGERKRRGQSVNLVKFYSTSLSRAE